ncbi:hypothetical protein CTAYLR_005932 [Chrysophaeum taylorii]|uniref:Fe2OG dioxygenase domain-containing protein n=1 Tax=Chrysophaeum taylorii TaxID=2483200 RepID=A0AAD7UCX9_9STRA|nr:hypothetical protein CTAYLR_005932 [Chrysophaeum taylorii]
MLILCLIASSSALSSRGFGPRRKSTAQKRSRPPKKIVVAPPPLDRWGLPLDADERAEDEPVEAIRARCTPVAEQQLGAFPEAWRPRLRELHADPLVIRVEQLLSSAECDEIVGLTRSARAKEMPRDAGTFDTSHAARRTSTTWYARFAEPEVAPLLARAADILDVDVRRFEELQIARYKAGEQFRWHEDAVPPPLLRADKSDGGQRLATLLVYLSGDGDTRTYGGTTRFRDLGRSPPLDVAPVKGDALLFFPAVQTTPPHAWIPDDRTVHAATPVKAGEKWVSQLWLHEAPYPPTILPDNDRPPELHDRIRLFSSPPPIDDLGSSILVAALATSSASLVQSRACIQTLGDNYCPHTADDGKPLGVLVIDPGEHYGVNAPNAAEGFVAIELFAARYYLDVVNAVLYAWHKNYTIWIGGRAESDREMASESSPQSRFRWKSLFENYCANVSELVARCENVELVRKSNSKDRYWWDTYIGREFAWPLHFGYNSRAHQQGCDSEGWCDRYNESLYRRWRTIGHHVVAQVHMIKPRVTATVSKVSVMDLINQTRPELAYENRPCCWLGVYARSAILSNQRRVGFQEYSVLIEHFLLNHPDGHVLVGAESQYFNVVAASCRLITRCEKNLARGATISIYLPTVWLRRKERAEHASIATRGVVCLSVHFRRIQAVMYRNIGLHERSLNLEYTGHGRVRVPWVAHHSPKKNALSERLGKDVGREHSNCNACMRARVAFANPGFLGMSLKSMSKDMIRNLRWADGPVVPMIDMAWPYFDREYGCHRSAQQHQLLECYFLPSNSCKEFSPKPLLVKKRDDLIGTYREVPSQGSIALCGHTSLIALRDQYQQPSSAEASGTKSRRESVSWRVECDSQHYEGRGGNENDEIVHLLGSSGDNEAYIIPASNRVPYKRVIYNFGRWRRFHQTTPVHPKQRKVFARESSLNTATYRGVLHFGVLALVALRPNRRTRAQLRDRMDSWRASNPSWPLHGDGNCAAIHVRHGDKLTPVWRREKRQDRGFNRHFHEYIDAALEALANRKNRSFNRNYTRASTRRYRLHTNQTQPTGARARVIFMTDDKDIVDEVPSVEAIRNVTLFTVPPGRPLISTRSISNDKKLRHVNHQIQCRKDILSREISMLDLQEELKKMDTYQKKRSRKAKHLLAKLQDAQELAKVAPKSCAHDYARDPKTGRFVGAEELLQWLATWELMAECDVFVGYSIADSFFTELIYIWLCVRRYARGQPCPRLVLLQDLIARRQRAKTTDAPGDEHLDDDEHAPSSE